MLTKGVWGDSVRVVALFPVTDVSVVALNAVTDASVVDTPVIVGRGDGHATLQTGMFCKGAGVLQVTAISFSSRDADCKSTDKNNYLARISQKRIEGGIWCATGDIIKASGTDKV